MIEDNSIDQPADSDALDYADDTYEWYFIQLVVGSKAGHIFPKRAAVESIPVFPSWISALSRV